MTTLANNRFKAIEDFGTALQRATWEKWWARLWGREPHLLNFGAIKRFLGTKRYRGVQEIPVEAIVGSVDRTDDFSRSFRPLHAAFSGRWVQVHMLAHTQGWPPIEVHRVGNLYFVEDGHHRVSVARHLKSQTIEAVVWDYGVEKSFEPETNEATLLAALAPTRDLQPCCTPCGYSVSTVS